jgi:16S rRNA processing protein RimM
MVQYFDENHICVGIVSGSHGLQGSVKIRSFMTVPKDIVAYGPVTSKNGEKSYKIRLISSNQKGLVVKLSGVEDRDASEALRGTELYLSRNILPQLDENEYYYSDLIGMPVEHINGEVIGVVGIVDNYGAGEIMEVDLKDGGTEMFQMSRQVVPVIDLKNRRVVVNPPTEIFADEDHDEEKVEE